MKRIVSVLLILITLFGCLSAGLSGFAASQKLAVTVKGTTESVYKVSWSYHKAAVFLVYVDGKYDGKKTFREAQSYTYTTDPYTAGVKHTIQLKIEIGEKIVGESDKIGSYLPPKTPSLSFKTNAKGYTITASVSSGTVHGYQLFSYNEKQNKYVYVANFDKTYSVTKKESLYKDIYKVRAYVRYAKKNYFSAYSSPLTCSPKLGTVNLKSVTSKKAGYLKLTWESVGSACSGYQIQYTSYDYFGTFRVQGVKKDKTAYDLKLIPGICYKVRMRCYRTVGKDNIYGDWSKVFTLYTKAAVSAKPNVKELLNKKTKVYDPGATGNEKLNKVLDKILAKIGCGPKSEYSTYNKLRCAYRYIATEQFKKDGDFKVKGDASGGSYAEQSTLRMLENKGQTGSCYEYNHLMHFLCIRMGLRNTYVVDGMVASGGGGRTGHWWMMMKIDGNNYYFDPRMQRYLVSTDINFLCLPLNGNNKYSDYFRFYDAKAELK